MIMTGIGGVLGGQLIAMINDRSGNPSKGSKNVSVFNIFWIGIAYFSLYICNLENDHGLLCYVSAFLIGSLDYTLISQSQVLIANYFEETSKPFAMLNIIKTLFTSSIFLVSSNIQSTKEFSLFWMVVGFFSLACQLIVLLTFRFADVIVKDKGKGGQQDLEMKLIDNNAK